MTCIDFNLILYDNPKLLLGHVPGPNCLFTDHGLLATTTFQSVCQSLSRRSTRPNIYLSRSVLLHEFLIENGPKNGEPSNSGVRIKHSYKNCQKS